MVDKEVQTDCFQEISDVESSSPEDDRMGETCRTLEECLKIFNDSDLGAAALRDEEVILLVEKKQIPAYQLEKAVEDAERGVGIRRRILGAQAKVTKALINLPYKNYNYEQVRFIHNSQETLHRISFSVSSFYSIVPFSSNSQ